MSSFIGMGAGIFFIALLVSMKIGFLRAFGSIALGVLSGIVIMMFGPDGRYGFARLFYGIASIPIFTIVYWIGFYSFRDRTEDNSEYEKKKNTTGKSKNSDFTDVIVD